MSKWGIKRYRELKGLQTYFYRGDLFSVPNHQLPEIMKKEYKDLSEEERNLYHAAKDEIFISPYFDVNRDDPFIVRTVEEDPCRASGSYAQLVVVKIPDDVRWTIDEYDGFESVHEVHRVCDGDEEDEHTTSS